ncbi:nuclear transport factor 2 family protein [Myxococcota bacterium]|nr:nuclear transport factor 2 family protein [Myxococcota bacterium]
MSSHIEQIQRLMYEYAECVDLADFEGLSRLFAHGEIRSADAQPPGMRGEQVGRFYSRTNKVHPNGTLCTRHLATNTIIDVAETEETATARSYFVVLQATQTLPFQPIAGGRYHDRFDRVDDRWRFSERVILVDQIGNMSEHLTFDLSQGVPADALDLGES